MQPWSKTWWDYFVKKKAQLRDERAALEATVRYGQEYALSMAQEAVLDIDRRTLAAPCAAATASDAAQEAQRPMVKVVRPEAKDG